MLPEETEMLERDIQLERRKRAQARKERYAEEPVSPGEGLLCTFFLTLWFDFESLAATFYFMHSGLILRASRLRFIFGADYNLRASRPRLTCLLTHVGKRLRDCIRQFHIFK